MPRRAVLPGVLLLSLLGKASMGEERRPWDVPARLTGPWEISLCVGESHAWIRFRSVETGEIHTCGRYARGFGGLKDAKTGSELWPPARASGVLWDVDISYESAYPQRYEGAA